MRTLISALVVAIAWPSLAHADYWLDGGGTCRNESGGTGVVGMCAPVKWPTEMVEYRIAEAGLPAPYGFPDGVDAEAAAEAIRAAFATWNAVPCITVQFVEGPRLAMPSLRADLEPDFEPHLPVFFSDDPMLWNNARVGSGAAGEDGMTHLITGYVALNAKDHQWSASAAGEDDKLDIQSVVTALIGRHLGFTSNEEGNATYPAYATGDIGKRTLGTDDIAAMQYLYGGEVGCSPPEEPQEICVEMLDPDNNCPPRPMTTEPPPGPDGGPGGPDGGPGSRPDGGSDADTGTPPGGDDDDDDGGCDCGVADSQGRNAAGLLPFALLVLGRTLTRRRSRERDRACASPSTKV